MKKILIILIAIFILILGIILFNKNASAPTDDSVPSVVGATINGSQFVASSTSQTTVFSSSTSLRPERVLDFKFACSASKVVDAKIYIDGKDPRADIVLIDNATSSDGILPESRRLILKQRPSASGARYATDSGSIVFWSKDQDARIEENGKAIFTKCKLVSNQ